MGSPVDGSDEGVLTMRDTLAAVDRLTRSMGQQASESRALDGLVKKLGSAPPSRSPATAAGDGGGGGGGGLSAKHLKRGPARHHHPHLANERRASGSVGVGRDAGTGGGAGGGRRASAGSEGAAAARDGGGPPWNNDDQSARMFDLWCAAEKMEATRIKGHMLGGAGRASTDGRGRGSGGTGSSSNLRGGGGGSITSSSSAGSQLGSRAANGFGHSASAPGLTTMPKKDNVNGLLNDWEFETIRARYVGGGDEDDLDRERDEGGREGSYGGDGHDGSAFASIGAVGANGADLLVVEAAVARVWRTREARAALRTKLIAAGCATPERIVRAAEAPPRGASAAGRERSAPRQQPGAKPPRRPRLPGGVYACELNRRILAADPTNRAISSESLRRLCDELRKLRPHTCGVRPAAAPEEGRGDGGDGGADGGDGDRAGGGAEGTQNIATTRARGPVPAAPKLEASSLPLSSMVSSESSGTGEVDVINEDGDDVHGADVDADDTHTSDCEGEEGEDAETSGMAGGDGDDDNEFADEEDDYDDDISDEGYDDEGCDEAARALEESTRAWCMSQSGVGGAEGGASGGDGAYMKPSLRRALERQERETEYL